MCTTFVSRVYLVNQNPKINGKISELYNYLKFFRSKIFEVLKLRPLSNDDKFVKERVRTMLMFFSENSPD